LPIRAIPDIDKTAPTAHHPKDVTYLRMLKMQLAVLCHHYLANIIDKKVQKGTATGFILLAVMSYSRHAQG